jgi:DNA-binding transcriptional regulator YdaS (Cro superfamily)
MDTHQPSDKLFALLDFCGIRQRDIVQRLGVSKTLVSLWRSGHREVTAAHHAALIAYAEEIFSHKLNALQAEVAGQVLPPARISEIRTQMSTFVDLVDSARAERDISLMQYRLALDLTTLHGILQSQGQPETWDEETLWRVEEFGRRIATAARVLRTHVPVAQAHTDPATNTVYTRLMALTDSVLRQIRPLPGEP